MPTQEQFKREEAAMAESRKALRETRSSARDAKNEMNAQLQGASSTKERRSIKSQFGSIYDISTTSIAKPTPHPDTGKRNLRDDVQDFVSRERTIEEPESGGSSGLPEFPTNNGNVPDFKGILAWSVTEDEALWLQGTPQSPTDPKAYVDVLGYDPTPSTDNFSLFRMEFLEVIICKDGAPVTGNIFFAENPEQP